jgi:putative membrane protein
MEIIVNRRKALLGVAGAAALPMFVSRVAEAQTGDQTMNQFVKTTLQYGELSKATSRIAHTNAMETYVKEFAEGEILEQTAIAQSLTSMQKPSPVPLTEDQKMVLQKIKEHVGQSDFDIVYVRAQLKAHQTLYTMFKGYVDNSPNYSSDLTHIILIGLAFVRNHVYILKQLEATIQQ